MSVVTEVKRQEVGYRFHLAIDKELHVDSGTRTPDKVTVHASMEGHENTFEEAKNGLKTAKNIIMEEIKSLEPEKPAKEKAAEAPPP